VSQDESLSVITEFSDALPVGICVLDPEMTIILWNRTLAEWSGRSFEEVVGKNLLDLYPDLDTPAYRTRIDQVLDGGPPAVFSSQLHTSFIPCRKADGMLRVQQTSVIRYPGSDPDHSSAMIIIEDVTELDSEIRSVRKMKDQALLEVKERKKAEEELRESERRYRDVVSDMDEFIVRFLPDRTILFANDAYLRFLGKSRDEVFGKQIDSFIHPDDREKVAELYARITPDNPTHTIEQRVVTADSPDQMDVWQRWNTRAIFDEDGNLSEYQSVGLDITEQMWRDLELAMINEELLAANKQISETKETLHLINKKLHLLSGITRHDILNKIMVIDGFLGFAEEIATDPTQAEYLGHVRAAAMVIQNILVFNRQYEQLGIEKPSWFAIDTLIEGIETEERLPLNSACEGLSIYCDPMLEKVFYNLYDNALRHAEGATRIEIACHPSSSGLIIVWEDDGTGVPEDEKEEIFKRGFGKNTGMGLFLVREILAITGITITETGEEGKGARFEISVPEGAYRIGNPAR